MANIHNNIQPLFTEIANAIRFKTGGTEKIKADDFPDAINAIQTETIGTPPGDPEWLSDDDAVIGYIQHDISGAYKNSELTQVKSYAFHNQYGLTKVSFPACQWIGQYAFQNCSSLSWVSLLTCKSIQSSAFQSCNSLQSITAPVVSYLGAYAFEKCQSLEFVQMNEVRNIDVGAFRHCYSLKTITFPECIYVGSQAFQSCSTLENINLIKCTTILSEAFRYNNGLINLYLPRVTTIEYAAFHDCYNLETINLPVLVSLGEHVFGKCSKLQYVSLYEANGTGYAAFSCCTSISTVFMPKATRIDSYMFSECVNLTSVSAPQVINVLHNAFRLCESLSSIEMLWCETVSALAFYRCYNLSFVSMPSVSRIYTECFMECSSLKSVNFPLIKTSNMASKAFRNCIELESAFFSSLQWVPQQGFFGNWKLSDFRAPLALSIGSSAFRECWSLSIVSFPDATTIYERAFADCSNLRYASFPNVVSLYSAAFYGCWNLEYASFPKVSYIGNYMFMNCSKLSYINFNNAKIIGNYAFAGCKSLSVLSEMNQASLIGMGAFMDTIISYASLPSLRFMPSILFFATSTLTECYFENCVDMYPFAMAHNGMSVISVTNFPNLKKLSYRSDVSAYWGLPTSISYAFSYYQGTSNYVHANDYTLEPWYRQNSEKAEELNLMMEPWTVSYSTFLSYLNNKPDRLGGHFAFNSKLTECTLNISTIILHSNIFGCWEACPNLEFLSLPMLASISVSAVSRCSSPFNYGTFKSIFVPLLSTPIQFLFGYCSRLESVYAPTLSVLPGRAFIKCSAISSITQNMMPSVKAIHGWAFEECPNLKYVDFPSVTSVSGSAFQNCSNIEEVHFTGDYKSILAYTFQSCYSLKTLNMPQVTTINNSAFIKCFGMNTEQHLVFPGVKNINAISSNAFGNTAYVTMYSPVISSSSNIQDIYFLRSIDLPNASGNWITQPFRAQGWLSYVSVPLVKNIPNEEFRWCRSLKTIYAPSVTSIGDSAFEYCETLEEVDFPVLTKLGNNTFGSCYLLKSAIFPYVTSVPYGAFYKCSSLSSIRFTQASIIHSSAFLGCTSLTAITSDTFPLVSSVASYAFVNCGLSIAYFPNCNWITYNAFYDGGASQPFTYFTLEELGLGKVQTMFALYGYTNMRKIVFPELISTPASFCYGLSKLTDVSLPKVQTIEISAFAYCKILSEVYFPEAVTLASYAFYSAPLLKTAILPKVTNIGECAFSYCSSINGDTMFFDSLKSISAGGRFGYCSNFKRIESTTFPVLETINWQNFWYGNLEYVNLPEVTYCNSAFAYNYNVSEWHMPKLKTAIYTFYETGYVPTDIRPSERFWLDSIEDIQETIGLKGKKQLTYIYAPNCKNIGKSAFENCTSLSSFNFDSVETIGCFGFYNCYNLPGVDENYFPNVTKMEWGAFAFCSGLSEKVRMSKLTNLVHSTTWNYNHTCFANTPVKEAVFDSLVSGQITWLGFRNNHPIEKLSFPELTTILNQDAFISATSLKEIYLPKLQSLTTSNNFYDCRELPSIDLPSLSLISGSSTFANCLKLSSVSLPLLKRITSSYTFEKCPALEYVYMPELEFATAATFVNCTALKSVSFPKLSSFSHGTNYTDHDYLFAYASNLENVTLGLEKITCRALTGNNYRGNIKYVAFPEATTFIDGAFERCYGLEDFSLPKIQNFGSRSEIFEYCSSLKEIRSEHFSTITPGTTLPILTFRNCTSLSKVHLTSNITRISSSAFISCPSLHTVILENVSYIDRGAFFNCTHLMSLYILTSTVCSMSAMSASPLNTNNGIFVYTPIHYSSYTGSFGSIFVPESMVDAYKSASMWIKISDRITAYIP